MEYQITNDFIGVFQGFYPNDFCDRVLGFYQQVEASGLADQRPRLRHHVEDQGFDLITGSARITDYRINYVASEFIDIFWKEIYPLYSERYSILKDCDRHQIYDVKIQKTRPGQGYHQWHSEATGRLHSNRILVFSMFLNDVELGGETEFLYQQRRFPAEKNTLLLWPAGFTHTHRGNPPLSGDKYIVTGWVEF